MLGRKDSFRGHNGADILRENLNHTELLYCYDNSTAICDIARLCGCPVVIIPDGSYTKEQRKVSESWNCGGIGFGLEEEQHAIDTIDSEKIRKWFIEAEASFQDKLTDFITETQK